MVVNVHTRRREGTHLINARYQRRIQDKTFWDRRPVFTGDLEEDIVIILWRERKVTE